MKTDRETRMRVRDAIASWHEPEAARVLGEMLWVVLVFIMAIAAVGSIGYGMYQMRTPLATEVEPTTTVGARKSITRAELIKILDAFNLRAEEYQARRIEAVPIKDPS